MPEDIAPEITQDTNDTNLKIGTQAHCPTTSTSCDNLGISQNIFHRLDRVSASNLHKPDMLYTIYLGLFKHMMDCIEGFLKKHGRLQAFDDVWKALPPYPGFLIPNKAYREVTQSQGKQMRNLGPCILGVLAVALRQPGGALVIPFKRALRFVRALVDFNMMAQYQSHTSDAIAYMEDYLDQFHKLKDIFLEFRVTKRTQDCNMCTCSGNGTQEQAVHDLLCLFDLYLVYLI